MANRLLFVKLIMTNGKPVYINPEQVLNLYEFMFHQSEEDKRPATAIEQSLSVSDGDGITIVRGRPDYIAAQLGGYLTPSTQEEFDEPTCGENG